ncbi:N-formylglutamate amidohydrolase [Algicella marina]|uniref:N-formylglutamate amidohydrolase n=2 Tax=Algicella marina TaxID=2683284 RepID=A0A6P1T432_9RHOB|nr:N-formylglutamate amidohydrolase [Algicella marina]QHQ37508.1 N-formylglutamate amidohydrolase [Algicella marina]
MAEYRAFEVVNELSSSPVLLLCDHASNFVPPTVSGGDLGLSAEDMARHIAWDVGAAALTRLLSAQLGAAAILSNFSRLVIDPNRGPDDPTLLMKLYDGSIIPANRHADAAELERRKALCHTPYHDAITARLDAMEARGQTPHILSIHSFTPQLRARPPRPWHVGILWDSDTRLVTPLLEALRDEPDIVTGDNEPYTGRLEGDCMHRHGTMRGLPHVLIEIRNDLISGETGQQEWAARLTRLLAPLLPT